MKNHIIAIILICFSTLTFAQKVKKTNYLGCSVYYPVAVGNNFVAKSPFGKAYIGNIAVETAYNHQVFKNYLIGVNLNYASFTRSSVKFNDTKVYPSSNFESYSPTVNIGYHNRIKNKITVNAQQGIGYSLFRQFQKANDGFFSYYNSMNAITSLSKLKIGYLITENTSLSLNTAYSFSKVKLDDYIPDTAYNNQIHVVQIGVGLEFKI